MKKQMQEEHNAQKNGYVRGAEGGGGRGSRRQNMSFLTQEAGGRKSIRIQQILNYNKCRGEGWCGIWSRT